MVIDILKIFSARAATEIQRMQAEEALHTAEQQLRATVELTPNVAIQWYDQDGRVLFWNHASETMFGWSKEEAEGKTLDQLIRTPDEMSTFIATCQEVQRTGKPKGPTEYTFRRCDGTYGTCISTIFALPESKGKPSYACMDFDITERKSVEAQIQHLAFHDTLTNLPNRALFQKQLPQILNQAQSQGYRCALILIDLDNFKTINDSLGHDVGDRLLQVIANRIQENTNENMLVARLGGDEFAVIIGGISNDPVAAEASIQRIADNIISKLAQNISLDDRELRIRASVGILIFGSGMGITEVVQKADIALNEAKSAGRNIIKFFKPGMQDKADRRLELERGLHSALDNGELLLHFQPQVSTSGSLIGAEVLLRWKNPELGFIPPAIFIPIAEETGLIHPIGDWVISKVCKCLKACKKSANLFNGHLAINISPWQFAHPDFVQRIEKHVAVEGIDPSRITLELTESALLYDFDSAVEILNLLNAKGFGLALDDFGTGYSSLAYLQKLPMKQLKVDQSFIRDLHVNQDSPLIEFIVNVGKRLEMFTVAEGVETEYQRDILRSMGCDALQGYLVSKPITEEEWVDWLTNKSNSFLPERYKI